MQSDSHYLKKRFSQNFLEDKSVIEKIINIINPEKNDHLIEIGPGKGALTVPIIKFVKKIDVIEIDKQLVKLLKDNIDDKKLTIHEYDALKFDYSKFKKHYPKWKIEYSLKRIIEEMDQNS